MFSIGLAAFILAFAIPALSFGQALKDIRAFDSVRVDIADEEVAKHLNVYQAQLQTVAELALRREGLLGPEMGNGAWITVSIRLMDIAVPGQQPIAAVFTVHASVGRLLLKQKKPSGFDVFPADVVTVSNIVRAGVPGIDKRIEEVIKSLLDMLMNDYYKANPKKDSQKKCTEAVTSRHPAL